MIQSWASRGRIFAMFSPAFESELTYIMQRNGSEEANTAETAAAYRGAGSLGGIFALILYSQLRILQRW